MATPQYYQESTQDQQNQNQYRQQPQPAHYTIIIIDRDHSEYTVESDAVDNNANNEEKWYHDLSKRNYFIRRVLGTVGLQLLFCSFMIALALYIETFRDFLLSTGGGVIIALALCTFLCLYIAVVCCNLGRGKPNASNVSILVLMTFLFSLFLAAVTIKFEVHLILLSAACTVGVVYILLLVTICTKIRLESIAMYLIAVVLVLFCFGLSAVILSLCDVLTPGSHRTLYTILCGLLVLYFALRILCVLNLIVGGKDRQYQFEEEDWLLASIMLFAEIVIFFIYMMQCLRASGAGD